MIEAMIGEFSCQIHDGGIYLPERFYKTGDEAEMIMFQEGKWISLQIWRNIPAEEIEILDAEHVNVLKRERFHIGENGYLALPKAFLEQVGTETKVIVAGILSHIEILTVQEMEELEADIENMADIFENLCF